MQSISFNKKQDIMDIDEFCINIKKGIQHRLGSKCYVSIQELVKNNGVKLRELTIIEEGDNNSPSICLNCYYSKYRKDGSIDAIEMDIIDMYNRNK